MGVKKKLVSVLLTAGLLLSLMPLSVMAAESTSADEGATETDQPPVVTDLYWSKDDLTACWKKVDSDRYYKLELYKDGELYATRYANPDIFYGGDIQSYSFEHGLSESLSYISQSGSYQFRIAASCALYDPDDPVEIENPDFAWGEFSELSSELNYQRPSQELGTTVGYWDQETAGLFHFAGVDGANGYMVNLYKMLDDGTFESYRGFGAYGTTFGFDYADSEGAIHDIDLLGMIREDGKYCVAITAWSLDPYTLADGKEGDKSGILDTKQSSDDANSVLDKVLASENLDDAMELLKSQTEPSQLQIAMQTDTESLNKVKELESRYAKEKGITVEAIASQGAENYVDASKITMVGAALNADASGTVSLEIKVPDKKVDVDTNRYANSVQLDLKLWNDGQAKSELDVPITITMPIPKGVQSGHLTILHYHENGTSEPVKVTENNDGTITFTVTSFSTFVFANEVETSDTSNDSDGKSATNNKGTSDSSTDNKSVTDDKGTASTNDRSSTVATTSPKTGDTGIWMFLIVLVAGMGAVVYGTYGFKKVK